MPVYAQDDIALNFNSGYVGVGWNFPMNDDFNRGTGASLLNIGIEHRPTNIGLEVSPYKYYSWTGSTDKSMEDHSFFNLNLYWNAFTLLEGFFYFGPFASVNYFFVGESVYWDRFVFTTGGRIGLRINFDGLNYDLLSAEVGYRNINGANKYFVGVKSDMLAFFLFLLYIAISPKDSTDSTSK